MSEASLRITEIFYSLQGETNSTGLPTVFVRLTGCPLRCTYCDSAYAFKGGKRLAISQILSEVKQYDPVYVTVTGGEPLAQPECLTLLTQLCDLGMKVSLETSGAIDIKGVDERVSVVLDLKTPDSNESHRNVYENLALLKPIDQVKFVICSQKDYEWSKNLVQSLQLNTKVDMQNLFFSPSYGQLEPSALADWILSDNLRVRLQVQLHKYIWGDVPGK